MHDHEQRPVRRLLDEAPQLRGERGLVHRLDLLELDFLVEEPVARIDQHPHAQRLFDPGIEEAEPEVLVAVGAEALLQGTVVALGTAVGRIEETIGSRFAQLRDGHAPKRQDLGPPHDRVGAHVHEPVKPDSEPQRHDENKGQTDPQPPFETCHLLPSRPIAGIGGEVPRSYRGDRAFVHRKLRKEQGDPVARRVGVWGGGVTRFSQNNPDAQ